MKKWMPLLLAGVVMVSTVGCSKGSTEPNGSSAPAGSTTASKQQLDINMMTVSYAGGGWPKDSPVIKELNKKLKSCL